MSTATRCTDSSNYKAKATAQPASQTQPVHWCVPSRQQTRRATQTSGAPAMKAYWTLLVHTDHNSNCKVPCMHACIDACMLGPMHSWMQQQPRPSKDDLQLGRCDNHLYLCTCHHATSGWALQSSWQAALAIFIYATFNTVRYSVQASGIVSDPKQHACSAWHAV